MEKKIEEIDQLKIAIKDYINEPELNNLIDKTIELIYLKGCEIKASKFMDYSKHSDPPTFGCYIVLGVSHLRDKLHILWDLFHEFGHHLDLDKLNETNRNNPEARKRREVTAWNFADKEFIKYPELEKFRENYIAYQAYCLNKYGVENYQSLF